MKPASRQFWIVQVVLFACQLMPVAAALPTLNVKGWYGNFIALETRSFHFGLTADAKGTLAPLGKTGDPVSAQIRPSITFVIEETFPDGKVVARQIRKETLESATPASIPFQKVAITGKMTGEAAFAAEIEADRGAVLVGGRITDPGTLTANPLQFVIRVTFPSAYRSVSVAARQEKPFLRRVDGDRLDLVFTDGKRLRHKTAEAVDANDPKLNGAGIASAKVQIDAYQGRVFDLSATGGANMILRNAGGAPLHDGFALHWRVDTAHDPEGLARLRIEVK
jgi:hypothetical protein